MSLEGKNYSCLEGKLEFCAIDPGKTQRCQQILLFTLLNVDSTLTRWRSQAGKFPQSLLVCRSQMWPAEVACRGAPGWHGCMERPRLQNTAMVQTSRSTSCDHPSFPCFCRHPWSPQHLLFPRSNSLFPPQSMKTFETKEVAETEQHRHNIFVFSKHSNGNL